MSFALLVACRPSAASLEREARVERLCGTWRASLDAGVVLEERWRVGEEGLIGEGVQIDAQGREQITETFVIELRDAGSTYRARPLGAATDTAFEQVDDRESSNEGWVWAWANPSHDFPQRIEYAFEGRERMTARVSGEGAPSFAWTFERVAACPTPHDELVGGR